MTRFARIWTLLLYRRRSIRIAEDETLFDWLRLCTYVDAPTGSVALFIRRWFHAITLNIIHSAPIVSLPDLSSKRCSREFYQNRLLAPLLIHANQVFQPKEK